MNNSFIIQSNHYLCRNFEAIHNKDYSVVKTFKVGPPGLAFCLLYAPVRSFERILQVPGMI